MEKTLGQLYFENSKLNAELSLRKMRAELAERMIDVSPCDPDITSQQIQATKDYNDFVKNNFDEHGNPKVSVVLIGYSEAEGYQNEKQVEVDFEKQSQMLGEKYKDHLISVINRAINQRKNDLTDQNLITIANCIFTIKENEPEFDKLIEKVFKKNHNIEE